MILNLGEFSSFQSIVIPSLVGISADINPDETVAITADQSSFLCKIQSFYFYNFNYKNIKKEFHCPFAASCTFIVHPIGSLLSIIICDKYGRQKSILALTIPISIAWIVLGFAQSFSVICVAFAVIGFCMGLKEAPANSYISEICEPSIRGTMLIIGLILYQIGMLSVFSFGAIFPWRTVAFVCALCPLASFVAVIFVIKFNPLTVVFILIFLPESKVSIFQSYYLNSLLKLYH